MPNNIKAFPHDPNNETTYNGMTLRDYFAAQIIAGVISRSAVSLDSSYYVVTCRNAYLIADVMLEVRK